MSNSNDKNNDNSFKDLKQQIANLRKMMDEIKTKKENQKNNSDIVFFSLDSPEFLDSSPTEFPKDRIVSPTNNNPIGNLSPDLASFFLEAGLLLHDVMYKPFKSRGGRLTDFFSWIERAADRMNRDDFSDTERNQFSRWCKSVGASLVSAQTKHGLWLTDDEEDLVLAMANGDILSVEDNGNGEYFNDDNQ